MKKYRLTLTEEQARVLSHACEFFARMKMGQFNMVIEELLDFQLPVDDYCQRRDIAESYLLAARSAIYPDLHGIGHSYGIGKFEDADAAFDIYQVMRRQFGDWREPFSFSNLPTCEVVEDESK